MKLGLGGIGEAFRDDNFRRYSLGSILSWISYFVQAVAVSWTTWELTHSTRWLAIVVLLDAAPNVALMPLGGVIADRFDRFRVMLLSYGFAWLQAVALTWMAWAGQLTIERLAALAFLHGAIHAFSIPAQYGFLPRFVERKRLSSAISVAAAYTQLAVFAGPALAGWLILHFGVVAAYASNVVGYGVFFAFVAFLRTPAGYVQPPASGKSFLGDFLEGLDAIRAHHGILALLALMLMGAALYQAIAQMAPAIAERILARASKDSRRCWPPPASAPRSRRFGSRTAARLGPRRPSSCERSVGSSSAWRRLAACSWASSPCLRSAPHGKSVAPAASL